MQIWPVFLFFEFFLTFIQIFLVFYLLWGGWARNNCKYCGFYINYSVLMLCIQISRAYYFLFSRFLLYFTADTEVKDICIYVLLTNEWWGVSFFVCLFGFCLTFVYSRANMILG